MHTTTKTNTVQNWRVIKRGKDVLNAFSMAAVFGLTTALAAGSAMAAPTGGVVTQGQASIAQAGKNTNINQVTNRVDIDWRTFSSARDEAINFNQPSTSALAVNRVTGGVPSNLQGALNANGRVFILNNKGVTFHKSATVNVGSLLATTAANVSIDGDTATFEGAGNGTVINQGNISVSNGGFAVLAAPTVINEGKVNANLGKVALASANSYTLDFRGDNLITYAVNNEVAGEIGVTNTGSVEAKSGLVTISAAAADKAIKSVINLGGVVDASAFSTNANGGTVLVNSAGDINNSATINVDADVTGNAGTVLTVAADTNNFQKPAYVSAQGGSEAGNGGYVEVSGDHFRYQGEVNASSANGEAGTLFIDPPVVTIADGANAGAIDTVYEQDIENQSQNIGHVIIEGSQINVNDIADDEIAGGKYDITLRTSATPGGALDVNGGIFFDDSNDTLSTTGGNITLEAGRGHINAGNLLIKETSSNVKSHSITVSTVNAGDIRLTSAVIEADSGTGTINIDANDDLFVAGDIRVTNVAKHRGATSGAESIINIATGDDLEVSGSVIAEAKDAAGTIALTNAVVTIDAGRDNADNDKVSNSTGETFIKGDLKAIADSDNTSGSELGARANADIDVDAALDFVVEGNTMSMATADTDNGPARADADFTVDAGLRGVTSVQNDVNLGDVTIYADANSNGRIAYDVTANANGKINTPDGVNVGTVNVDALGGTLGVVGDDVFVEFLGGESVAFRNTLGFYAEDANGEPIDGEVLFSNARDVPVGTTVTFTVEDADQLGFFLIPDGARQNPGQINDGDTVTFQKVGNEWFAFNPTQLVGVDDFAPQPGQVGAYFTNQALNVDGAVHVQDAPGVAGNLNWEDLLISNADLDYNDVSLNYTTQERSAEINTMAMFGIMAGDDVTISNPVNVNAISDNNGVKAVTSDANARTDIISMDGAVTIDADVKTFAKAQDAATAYTNVEANGGEANINGYLEAMAMTTMDGMPAKATVRVFAPEAFDLNINGTEPQAIGDTASLQDNVSGMTTVGEDMATLILRDAPVVVTPVTPTTPTPVTPQPQPEPVVPVAPVVPVIPPVVTPNPEFNLDFDPNLLNNARQELAFGEQLGNIAPAAGDISEAFCRVVNVAGSSKLLCGAGGMKTISWK